MANNIHMLICYKHIFLEKTPIFKEILKHSWWIIHTHTHTHILGPHLWHMEVARLEVEVELQLLPMPQSEQYRIWAASATYTTAHGNTGALTHWARPGMEPASSWILFRFVTTEPQWELPDLCSKSWLCHFSVSFWAKSLISLFPGFLINKIVTLMHKYFRSFMKIKHDNKVS